MSYLSIKNLARYQHYKTRRPPWVKLYQSILEDLDFIALPDASKWLAVGLLLVASRYDNCFPSSKELLAKVLHTTEPIDLQPLLNMGYLVEVEGVAKRKSASKKIAKRKHVARPLVQSREYRVQRENTTTASQPAVAATGLREWLAPIAQAWESVNGAGSFPWARGTKALKPLFGKVESATLAERLGRYLEADGKFASPERFVITHGQHAETQADKHAAAVKAKRDRMFQEQGANLPNGDMTEIMDLVTNPNRVAEARRLGVIL